ncbi:MAG: hypothetical protein QW117_03035 [Candidatus Pacearchaeota archaeon]
MEEEKLKIFQKWEKILEREGLSLKQINSKLISNQKNYFGNIEEITELKLHENIDYSLLDKNYLRRNRLNSNIIKNKNKMSLIEENPIYNEYFNEFLDDKEYLGLIYEGFFHIGTKNLEK